MKTKCFSLFMGKSILGFSSCSGRASFLIHENLHPPPPPMLQSRIVTWAENAASKKYVERWGGGNSLRLSQLYSGSCRTCIRTRPEMSLAGCWHKTQQKCCFFLDFIRNKKGPLEASRSHWFRNICYTPELGTYFLVRVMSCPVFIGNKL